MVQECCDSYQLARQANGGAVITIQVPRRFVDLWAAKLSELRVTDNEIREHEPQ
jgi:hypothetical protein